MRSFGLRRRDGFWRSVGTTFGSLGCVAAVLISGCTGVDDAAGIPSAHSEQLSLAPRFAQLSNGAAFDRARMTIVGVDIFGAPTTDTLAGPFVFDLPAGATTWSLPLEFNRADGHDAIAVIGEFLSVSGGKETVEYSGLTSTIDLNADRGGDKATIDLPLFPGPVENLSLRSIQFASPPETMTEGDSTRLRVVSNGIAVEHLLWKSADTTISTVRDDGGIRPRRNGKLVIYANAGRARDSAVIQVLARAASIVIAPDTARNISIGEDVRFAATVRDARGGLMPDEPLLWTSANGNVLQATSGGHFTGRGTGVTTVRAASIATPSVASTAVGVVTTRIASNLRITWVGTNPTQATAGTNVNVLVVGGNTGTVGTPPAFARLTVLNAVTHAVVFDTLISQPETLAGQPIAVSVPIRIDASRGWPSSIQFRVFADALNSIPETDENDNFADSNTFTILPGGATASVVPASSAAPAVRTGH